MQLQITASSPTLFSLATMFPSASDIMTVAKLEALYGLIETSVEAAMHDPTYPFWHNAVQTLQPFYDVMEKLPAHLSDKVETAIYVIGTASKNKNIDWERIKTLWAGLEAKAEAGVQSAAALATKVRPWTPIV